MGRLQTTGAAAAAGLILVTGCSDGGKDGPRPPDSSASAPSASGPSASGPSASAPGHDGGNGGDTGGGSGGTAPGRGSSPPPDSPEGRLNALAGQKGWTAGAGYASPAAYVHQVCDTLASRDGDETRSRGQWLTEVHRPDADRRALLRAGAGDLCPRWADTVVNALNGVYERWYADGEFEIGEPAPGDSSLIVPGTYRTGNRSRDCRWERRDASGAVLDSGPVTASGRTPDGPLTVTVRATDGSFSTTACGTWKPVD
ncbi:MULTISPECIES: hypothetical protein [Streptomyces]|uniref:hypothetical protein n=1 Tax=Streptomyces TaxID=1883 RepID=UPI0022AA5A2E|nr:hypothetical protein [Streptomyces sp. HB2AG]MCZ2526530.1 hypothetical protein [Streptomyces sp. HB2AG]